MILYHGSNINIEIIDLAKSKPNKDSGRDFICRKMKHRHKK